LLFTIFSSAFIGHWFSSPLKSLFTAYTYNFALGIMTLPLDAQSNVIAEKGFKKYIDR